MSAPAPLHTREQFSLVANAPFEVAWPLFGADRERAWAPDWDPVFLWPHKAFDQEGMVFKVGHGEKNAVWVNTAFDPSARRIQYVYLIPDVVVTVITLKLTPESGSTTVEVIYERTALEHAANDIVKKMALRDRLAGNEWSQQINAHLSQ
jgi:meiotically up-regulated gene 157 (Mug157) protein